MSDKFSRKIAVGSLVTVATLAVAFLYARRKQMTADAEQLFEKCEGALQRLSAKSSDSLNAA